MGNRFISDLLGTFTSIFQIGNKQQSGSKTLRFQNAFTGDLTWNPTANRTLALPDATGTLALYESIAVTNLANGTGTVAWDTASKSDLRGYLYLDRVINITLSNSIDGQRGTLVVLSAGSYQVYFNNSVVGNYSVVQGASTWTTLTWVYANGNYVFTSSATSSSSSAVAALAYTTPGTYNYTIPDTATTVRFVAYSSGAGGGSGRRGAAGTARSGGGGAASGSFSEATYRVTDLETKALTVVVGAGGDGGAAVTTDDTNGNNGSNGNSSSVAIAARTLVFASAPSSGGGGTNSSGTAGTAGSICTTTGANGGASSATGTASNGTTANTVPGSGAGGGGIDASNTARAGAQGGLGFRALIGNITNTNFGGANTGGAGTSGVAMGSGAGGGGANLSGAGGKGGDGAFPGGGAGGGGASVNGSNSGAGGKGGDGAVYIYLS